MTRKAGDCWTEEELRIVRDNYGKIKGPATAQMLPGRTIMAVQKIAARYGIPRWHKNRSERDYRLQRSYGITREQYEEMFLVQNGCCLICRKPETVTDKKEKIKPLSVDHNHTTGKIRGLLCLRCNQMIGMAREDSLVLRSAVDYLEKNR